MSSGRNPGLQFSSGWKVLSVILIHHLNPSKAGVSPPFPISCLFAWCFVCLFGVKPLQHMQGMVERVNPLGTLEKSWGIKQL